MIFYTMWRISWGMNIEIFKGFSWFFSGIFMVKSGKNITPGVSRANQIWPLPNIELVSENSW